MCGLADNMHTPVVLRTRSGLLRRARPVRRTRAASPAGIIGLVIVTALVLCALFADQIALYGPEAGSLSDARMPPAWQPGGDWSHPLGTDPLGQDVFSRIIHGSRVSLTVGLFGAILASIIGVSLGLAAGYFGGVADRAISAVVQVLLSVPYVVLVIVIATIFGRSLLNVILIFGITGSPIFVRVTRAEIRRLKNEEYVQAAVCLGASPRRVLAQHLLPNMMGTVITLVTFEMSAMILYESGLSFLGLSVPPNVPSWGNMLALGRQYLPIFPWLTLYPGAALVITSLGVNLLGDALREWLDPRLRPS